MRSYTKCTKRSAKKLQQVPKSLWVFCTSQEIGWKDRLLNVLNSQLNQAHD